MQQSRRPLPEVFRVRAAALALPWLQPWRGGTAVLALLSLARLRTGTGRRRIRRGGGAVLATPGQVQRGCCLDLAFLQELALQPAELRRSGGLLGGNVLLGAKLLLDVQDQAAQFHLLAGQQVLGFLQFLQGGSGAGNGIGDFIRVIRRPQVQSVRTEAPGEDFLEVLRGYPAGRCCRSGSTAVLPLGRRSGHCGT